MISGGEKAMMSPPMTRTISAVRLGALRPRSAADADLGGRERLLGRLVGDQLERADQADAARLADQRVIGQARASPSCRTGATARTWPTMSRSS